MKKALIVLLVLTAIWLGLKDIALQSYLTNGALNISDPLAYESEGAWASLPETLPPGAWETPWGIDAFIVLPPANVNRKHGLLPVDTAGVLKEKAKALETISVVIPKKIPVYAPVYRAPSPATKGQNRIDMYAHSGNDLVAAFEHYLAHHNQGRGVILIIAESSGPYASLLIDRLQTEDLVSRFAGLLSFGPEASSYKTKTLKCAEVLKDGCHQRIATQVSSDFGRLVFPHVSYTAPPLDVIDTGGVSDAIRIQVENVSTWLDETQPKPAEPFFVSETIESSPIFRPGADTPINEPNEN